MECNNRNYNDKKLIGDIRNILEDVIYIVDIRLVCNFTGGNDTKLFSEAYKLYHKISRFSRDADLYESNNKAFIQELYTLLKDCRNDFSKYPCNTSFDELFKHFDKIELLLEKIIRVDYMDYNKMKENNKEFYLELNKYVLNPERIERISSQFGIEFFDYLDNISV